MQVKALARDKLSENWGRLYAQQRMDELQQNGFLYPDALAIVSQELSHFRLDITEVYLR